MRNISKLLYFLFTAVVLISGCSNRGSTVVELKRYPVENLDGGGGIDGVVAAGLWLF